MYTDSDDICQYRIRRLDKGHAFLQRPATARGIQNLLSNWNCKILMPTDQPVTIGSLIEQRALHSDSILWKMDRNRWMALQLLRDSLTPKGFKQTPRTSMAREVR